MLPAIVLLGVAMDLSVFYRGEQARMYRCSEVGADGMREVTMLKYRDDAGRECAQFTSTQHLISDKRSSTSTNCCGGGPGLQCDQPK